MMGGIEVLQEMLQNKVCYYMLTQKKPFEQITANLVKDNEDVLRHMYQLLSNLIIQFEKFEKFEKRIVIDNFEDEEIENSGSFMGGNKSRNSRKNQDVLKDLSDSDLFQFVNVVIKEFIDQQVEQKQN
jgi:hypothetical protein